MVFKRPIPLGIGENEAVFKMMEPKRVADVRVAPMMDWTDRHCRFFHRLLSPHARLYTEMVTTGAVLHGDKARLLGFSDAERPLALQLGGSDAAALAESARIGESFGYDEINLNCGCPSERVQSGSFGACLMAEPETVAACVTSMKKAVSIPVTVKCRIGIDDCLEGPFLQRFIGVVADAGCDTFIVHARKAWLKGLSPKENREVPPLRYDIVQDMKREFPNLQIILNGGVKTVADVKTHLDAFDGIMIGRAAYETPWILVEIERDVFQTPTLPDKRAVVRAMADYACRMHRDHGTPVKSITRHMTGLFAGERGARGWRRALSEGAHLPGATAQILETALKSLQSA